MLGMEDHIAQPSDWVRHLGGEPIVRVDSVSRSPLELGRFRYLDLPSRFDAPPINAHYLSITVSGRPRIERVLNGVRDEAEFAPGTCLLMPAGQDNAWRWSEPTEEIEFFVNAAFFDDVATGAGLDHVSLDTSFAFTDKTLWRMAMIMLEETRLSDRTDAQWLEGAAHLLSLHLLRRYSKRRPQEAGGWGLTERQLRLVLEFTRENIGRPIQIEELSEVAGLSSYHFSRLFKKSTGEPPYRWLVTQRIARAKDLLRHTEKPIADIAAEVGFQTQSRFGCVFKERTGVTPFAYRKRCNI